MIRILIVDDQNLIREGLKVLLENVNKIKIVGDVSNGETALEKIQAIRPDVVLLDIDMPGIDGLTVAEQIRSKFPLVKTIMLSSHEDKSYVQKATALGAKGYLLKSATSEELEWSIKLVHQGYSAIKSNLWDKPLPQNEPSILHSNSSPKINLPPKSTDISFPSNSFSSKDFKTPKSHPDELELLLAKNQVRQKYLSNKYLSNRHQRRQKQQFHSYKLTRIKKTMMSFEFRLLVFAILSCLGFLIFVALS